MTSWVAFAVVGVVMASIAAGVANLFGDSDLRRDYIDTVRAIRWWMVPAAVGQLAAVVGVFVVIVDVAPRLEIGWWRLLGGSGNALLGQTGLEGVGWHAMSVAIPIGIGVLMPSLAHREELQFRLGSERGGWWSRFRRQLTFGLVHCLFVGVPIAAGLALTISGFYYERVYLTALMRQQPVIDAAKHVTGPARLPYPQAPTDAENDPDLWDAHLTEFDRVAEENRRRTQEWSDGLAQQIANGYQVAEDVAGGAVAKAAAAHAVSNWILIGLLVVLLIVV